MTRRATWLTASPRRTYRASKSIVPAVASWHRCNSVAGHHRSADVRIRWCGRGVKRAVDNAWDSIGCPGIRFTLTERDQMTLRLFALLARRSAIAMMGIFVLGTIAACSDSTASGSSKVSVLLTDAPGDVKAAVVTMSEIDLQGSGGTHVLMSTPVTTDLLTLAQSTAQLVNGAVVPAGNYEQLRFVITGGYIEVDNGDGTTSIYASSPTSSGLPSGAQVAGTLQMPSLAQSGIKVNLP